MLIQGYPTIFLESHPPVGLAISANENQLDSLHPARLGLE